MAAGFFFYLVLRASGRLVVAMALHGLWDFGLFTGNLGDEIYAGAGAFIAADVFLAVLLLVRRRHIELPETAELRAGTRG